MKNLGRRSLYCLSVLVALSGCASARYVLKDAESGVVAIPANSDSWPSHHRQKAEELMRQQFPDGYVIELEEEAVVGQQTSFNEDSDGGSVKLGKFEIGSGKRSGTQTTVNQAEWRIHYRRR